MLKNTFRFIFELLKIVIISLAIIIPVRYFLIQPFYVKGASMEPNFHDHEYLIIDEISYRFKEPVRGDIVVFRYPRNPQEYFIKRVIGLPGESVKVENGGVTLFNANYPNGVALDESYIPDDVKTYGPDELFTLKDDEYFLLGDNRGASKDSRSFGEVDRSFFTGKVVLRGWPFSKFQVFETPEYEL